MLGMLGGQFMAFHRGLPNHARTVRFSARQRLQRKEKAARRVCTPCADRRNRRWAKRSFPAVQRGDAEQDVKVSPNKHTLHVMDVQVAQQSNLDPPPPEEMNKKKGKRGALAQG